MAQPQIPEPLPTAQAPAVAPSLDPRPRLLDGGATTRPDWAWEELRLARLATEVLRQLVAAGTPSAGVLGQYLGVTTDEVLCMAEGVRRLPAGARRSLARVALAFAPSATRLTARRLLEGEMARLAHGRGASAST